MSTLPSEFRAGPPAGAAYWRGWPEVRADLRSAVRLALALAAAGVPAGLAWATLAPRADFRVTDAGPEPVGTPSIELLIADDAAFVLVLAVLGAVAGAAAWRSRRRRGVATALALAVGGSLAGGVAWQVGELLGPGPTEAQLADVGAVVTTSLTLGSPAALAVAPFSAVLAYVVAVLTTDDDGLGRTGVASPGWSAAGVATVAGPERPLVDVPPTG